MKQIVSTSYDVDTGILDIHLLTGEHYYVTNAGHARIIEGKISTGGKLDDRQIDFLEKYRVRDIEANKKKLADKIGKLRQELMP